MWVRERSGTFRLKRLDKVIEEGVAKFKIDMMIKRSRDLMDGMEPKSHKGQRGE